MWRILRIGALLVSVLLVCVPFVSSQSRPGAAPPPSRDSAVKTSPRRTVLSFERSPHFGAILVSVQVNGKPAVLILDTGSNTTILSPEICGLDTHRLPRAEAPRKGTGFVGDGRWGQATLTIGTVVWKNKRVLVADTKDLSRAAQRKIDGILGQDILDDFKYVEINLEAKQLTLGSD
jgi:predicted aspartyl protease